MEDQMRSAETFLPTSSRVQNHVLSIKDYVCLRLPTVAAGNLCEQVVSPRFRSVLCFKQLNHVQSHSFDAQSEIKLCRRMCRLKRN